MRVMGVTILGAFSGLDDAVFEGLRSRNMLVGIEEGRLPDFWKLLLMLKSFRPNKHRWSKAWHGAMMKTTSAFQARTRALDKVLRNQIGQFDVVLQTSGLFAPFRGDYPKPVCLLCDYTTKLAELNYRPWFGLTEQAAREWYSLETDLYTRASLIFTTNENARQSFIKHYGIQAERVRVVGAGVDQVYEHAEKTYNEQTILFVGIDFERKGGPTLLKAFAEVRKQIPQARLLIAGPRPGPEQDGVIWLGHVSDRQRVNEIFAEATVFTLPAICDPFPGAIREAMSHALPVIASQVDAMAEMVEEGVTGFLVPPGNAETLAGRMVRLLLSPKLCAEMGEAGRNRVRERFLWSQVVDRVEEGLRICSSGAE
jgi:glycosyltransferase involved in cell wall biosynthesis